jgi:hypothetical protein
MKHAHIVANERMEHQVSWGGAFGEGLRRHGWHVTTSNRPEPCDVLTMWGVRRKDWIDAQKCAGGEVVILERGYLGDRFANCSVSFGGLLNGRATFRGPFADGSRFERHHSHLMKPWRERHDGYALLIGQVPGDQSIAGVDIGGWYARTASELQGLGWDVRFRPHPVALQRGYSTAVPGIARINGDLASALDGAGVVVTFNSNTAVEAVLAGCPCISVDQGSMAWPVTGHQLLDIVTPDRSAWAHHLAWCQHSLDEMSSGGCWEAVKV